MYMPICPPPLINAMNSFILYKANTTMMISLLRTMKIVMMILTKSVAMGKRNWIFRLRVGKLEQWEVLSVERADDPSV